MNIGMIGIGNMGEALLSGILLGKKAQAENIYIYDISMTSMQSRQKEYGIHCAVDYKDLLEKSDYIFLTVKPNVYPQVLAEISPLLKAKHYLLSIAPGYDIKRLKKYLPDNFDHIILFMSNTAAKIGQATSAATFSQTIDKQKKDQFTALFKSFGSFLEIKEEQMPTITSVIGSAPAIIYMLWESLIQGAILEGISAKEAQELVANVISSSAAMACKSKEHPATLRDRICSPAGTTIAGVSYLEKKGFTGILIEAIHRMAKKARKMKK